MKLLAVLALLAPAVGLRAELAISANDSHLVQIDGVNTVVASPRPDSLTVIDLGARVPTVLTTVDNVPTSVIGPPFAVAISPDERIALVTSAMKVDPKAPTKLTEDNRVTVIDLKARPIAAIATLTAGSAPASVSINRQGTLALVANRGDGTVSVFTVSGTQVTPAGTVVIGNAASALGHVAITPDGTHALVSRDGDNLVSVLAIAGTRVTKTARDIRTGLRPYSIDITRDGRLAVVGNVGFGNGDTDTVSVVDLTAEPYRAVETLSVGQTPEGIKLSPDGRWCAAVVQNGSTKPHTSPFHADHGLVIVFRVDGAHLVRVADAPIGHWSQGAVFSRDDKTLLVGNMNEKTIQVFSWDGTTLTDTGRDIPLGGGSASLRSADL